MADNINEKRCAAIASIISLLEKARDGVANPNWTPCSKACREAYLSLLYTKAQDIRLLGRELREPFEGYNVRGILRHVQDLMVPFSHAFISPELMWPPEAFCLLSRPRDVVELLDTLSSDRLVLRWFSQDQRRRDQRQSLEGELIDEGSPREKRPRGADESPNMRQGDGDGRLGKRPRTLDAE